MSDLSTTLFWLRLVQLVLAIPLLSIAGQGVVYALARMFRQDPQANFFYRLLGVVASPATHIARWVTPRFRAAPRRAGRAVAARRRLRVDDARDRGRVPSAGARGRAVPVGSMIDALVRRARRGAWNQAAAWLLLFRQHERALTFYRRMVEEDPNDAVALASIGYQQAQAGENRAALATFDRVVALEPRNAEYHFDRGFLLQRLNDHDAAMAAFRTALDCNADHDRALYGFGLSLIACRRLKEAVAPLKRDTKLQPMSPYGWYEETQDLVKRVRYPNLAGDVMRTEAT